MDDLKHLGPDGSNERPLPGFTPPGWHLKGIPRDVENGGEIAGKSLLNDDLMLPAAILKTAALERNRAWMRDFLADTGIRLCPHGKTTMAPDLLHMQMKDGAWGITAATVQHVRIYRRFGINRIIMANQLVGTANIRWIIEERMVDPNFEFYCLVDSVEAATALSEAVLTAGGAPVDVLLELGRTGGRTGRRDVESLVELADQLTALRGISVAGLETFEGVFQGSDGDLGGATSQMDTAVNALAALLKDNRLTDRPFIFSAGGTAYFDVAVQRMMAATARWPNLVPILRSGCYITHDAGIYRKLFSDMKARDDRVVTTQGGFEPALEVWAHVQSLPEPGTVIVSLGRRDVGSDSGMPRLVSWARPGGPRQPVPAGIQAAALWDQHLKFHVPEPHDFKIGDLLGWGISHPCTTFDKWKALYFVDENDVVTGLTSTYF
ncbi:MAG: alanine racemase [Henriciella sp.]|nr:alanine racemase [Henriciella sp.]